MTTRPQSTAARDYAFPAFTRHKLANGLQVVVAPVHKLPIVTIYALVDAGAATDPAGKEGLAELTAQLLTEGTRSLSAEALTEKIEILGSALAADAEWDSAGVGLTVMSQRFAAALNVLAEVITHPALPDRELERLKEERLAALLQMRTEPRTLADEMFSALLYDPVTRYASPAGGSERSVRDISLDDVRQFHASRYTPATVTLIVVGDVSSDAAVSEIEKAFGAWAGRAASAVHAAVHEAQTDTRVFLVAKEGAPQSELRIGHAGISRTHPDYFGAVVLNAILGGLFSSRINLNLREKHGYTYGAFSQFDWRKTAGPFVISTAVRNDATMHSVREVLDEVARIVREPVSADELNLATSYMVGVFPIRFETTAAIANALATLVMYDLPAGFYDDYRGRIASVTREEVAATAARILRPDELRIVVVGDPESVHAPLQEFAAGKLRVYDASGHPA